MVKPHRDMNNTLKKRPIFLPPFQPNFLDDIVTIKEIAAVEQRNTFCELFFFRKYSKFWLNFQLKKCLSAMV